MRQLVTLPESTLGIVCDHLAKLADPEWVEATKKFLRKENPWGITTFDVWRTLTIGGVSKDELVRRLGDGFYLSNWAKDIMSKPEFVTAPEPHEVSLARVKVRGFGFNETPTTTKLFDRIKEVGDLCPAEVGPHLRLVDKDQPKRTWYWVAMEPITDSDGDPNIFDVLRDDGGRRWLNARYARPGRRWDLEDEIVFCLSK
ncbi:MAG: hypothetical protein HY454_01475 [Parcubacteria group bacterium]|nr:hypothetical protein [Parcubacteria group bacterium]